MKTAHEIVRETSHDMEIGDGAVVESRAGMLAVSRAAAQVRPLFESLRADLRSADLVAHSMHLAPPSGPDSAILRVACRFSYRLGRDLHSHDAVVFSKGRPVPVDGPVVLSPGSTPQGREIMKLVGEAASRSRGGWTSHAPLGEGPRTEELLAAQVKDDLDAARDRILHQIRDLSSEKHFVMQSETAYREILTEEVRRKMKGLLKQAPADFVRAALDACLMDEVLDD